MRRVSTLQVRDDRRLARARKDNSDYWIRGTANGRFPLSGRGCLWLGSFAALLLIAGTLYWGVPHLEAELEQRTLARLAEAGIETGGLEVDFSWRDGAIEGLVITEESAEQIAAATAGIDGVRSVRIDLEVAEVPTSTTVQGPSASAGPVSVIVQLQGDRMTLTGTVLTEDHRLSLVEAASTAFGAANLTDRLEVSGLAAEIDGADQRVESLAAALALIEPPTSGRIVLVDESLSSNLTVPSEDNRALLATAFGDSGLVGERQIDVDTTLGADSGQAGSEELLSPAQQAQLLQAELDELQAEITENVVFSATQSGLSPAARQTLDKVASAMNRYLQTVVEVEGHTDSAGTDEENLALSQSRAEAVAAYLVVAGVDQSRLSAVGYGPTRPIGDNSTNQGRQANRRVQFTAGELSP